jgi:16S rRNA (adenine1518-N6/adenine1519-N6)-dimethyltransferase
MNLTLKKNILFLLEKYEIKPQKSLGQNFLISEVFLDRIASFVEPGKTVLEVGPGLGTLTQKMARKAGKVIAVEKDFRMTKALEETMKDYDNVEIVHGDALDYQSLEKNYQVIANLPYYVATAIIKNFLESKNPPKEMFLTIQKEVAQRICAQPPDMNLLAVSVQFYAQPEILFRIPRNCFWPMPNVDSAVIRITLKQEPLKVKPEDFFRIVKAGFSRPRAQLLNNISKKLELNKRDVEQWLLKNNVQPKQRAETLKVEDWINLSEK